MRRKIGEYCAKFGRDSMLIPDHLLARVWRVPDCRRVQRFGILLSWKAIKSKVLSRYIYSPIHGPFPSTTTVNLKSILTCLSVTSDIFWPQRFEGQHLDIAQCEAIERTASSRCKLSSLGLISSFSSLLSYLLQVPIP